MGITRPGISAGTSDWHEPLESDLDAVFSAANILQTTLAGEFVDTVNLIDKCVTTSKIEDGAIVTSKLGIASVTEDRIANQEVTSDKIRDGAIITNKIATGTISVANMSANARKAENITLPATSAYNLKDNVDEAIKNIYEVIGEFVDYEFETPESEDVEILSPSMQNVMTVRVEKREGHLGGMGFQVMFTEEDGTTITSVQTQDVGSTITQGGQHYYIASFTYSSLTRHAQSIAIYETFLGQYDSGKVFVTQKQNLPQVTFDDLFGQADAERLVDEIAQKLQLVMQFQSVKVKDTDGVTDIEVDIVKSIKLAKR